MFYTALEMESLRLRYFLVIKPVLESLRVSKFPITEILNSQECYTGDSSTCGRLEEVDFKVFPNPKILGFDAAFLSK